MSGGWRSYACGMDGHVRKDGRCVTCGDTVPVADTPTPEWVYVGVVHEVSDGFFRARVRSEAGHEYDAELWTDHIDGHLDRLRPGTSFRWRLTATSSVITLDPPPPPLTVEQEVEARRKARAFLALLPEDSHSG